MFIPVIIYIYIYFDIHALCCFLDVNIYIYFDIHALCCFLDARDQKVGSLST